MTNEQLQAWREAGEQAWQIDPSAQIREGSYAAYIKGYLRRCQETEQAIKDARKKWEEEFKFRLTLLLDSSDYYAVENIDQYHIEADAMKGLLND